MASPPPEQCRESHSSPAATDKRSSQRAGSASRDSAEPAGIGCGSDWVRSVQLPDSTTKSHSASALGMDVSLDPLQLWQHLQSHQLSERLGAHTEREETRRAESHHYQQEKRVRFSGCGSQHEERLSRVVTRVINKRALRGHAGQTIAGKAINARSTLTHPAAISRPMASHPAHLGPSLLGHSDRLLLSKCFNAFGIPIP